MVARLARLVAPEMPHHIVQRGNRRQQVFFDNEDKINYLKILEEKVKKYAVKVWAYCLMDNHVHVILVPQKKTDLTKAIGETHKEYTRMINFRYGWRGYLWEGRFKSFILDEKYLYAAVRYVERNPVRAGIVETAGDYQWSSARSHIRKRLDNLLSDFYLLNEIADWEQYLVEDDQVGDLKLFRRHGATGRPLGDPRFLIGLAIKYGWELTPKKPGPKAKASLN